MKSSNKEFLLPEDRKPITIRVTVEGPEGYGPLPIAVKLTQMLKQMGVTTMYRETGKNEWAPLVVTNDDGGSTLILSTFAQHIEVIFDIRETEDPAMFNRLKSIS